MKIKNKLKASRRISIEDRSEDQEVYNIKSIIGSSLLILSGLLLFIDKFFDAFNFGAIELTDYVDFQTFLWHWGQNFSPILIIVAFLFGFRKIFLAVPITAYLIQTRWLITDLNEELELVGLYAAALILIIALVTIVIYQFTKNYENIIKRLLNHSMTARRSYVNMAVKATDGATEESEIIDDLKKYDVKFKEAISEVEELI